MGQVAAQYIADIMGISLGSEPVVSSALVISVLASLEISNILLDRSLHQMDGNSAVTHFGVNKYLLFAVCD